MRTPTAAKPKRLSARSRFNSKRDGADAFGGAADPLFQEIVRSHRAWLEAQSQFNEVSDPELIDHMVFRLDAAEQHFRYLLHQARQRQLVVEGVCFEWFELDDGV